MVWMYIHTHACYLFGVNKCVWVCCCSAEFSMDTSGAVTATDDDKEREVQSQLESEH